MFSSCSNMFQSRLSVEFWTYAPSPLPHAIDVGTSWVKQNAISTDILDFLSVDPFLPKTGLTEYNSVQATPAKWWQQSQTTHCKFLYIQCICIKSIQIKQHLPTIAKSTQLSRMRLEAPALQHCNILHSQGLQSSNLLEKTWLIFLAFSAQAQLLVWWGKFMTSIVSVYETSGTRVWRPPKT